MQFRPHALALVAALSAAGWGAAQAALLTQSQSLNFSLSSGVLKRTESGNSSGTAVLVVEVSPSVNKTQVLSFDLFDTSLGTLTGVQFSFLAPLGTDTLTLSDDSTASSDHPGSTQAKGSVTRSLSGIPALAAISLTSPLAGTVCSGNSTACATDIFVNSPAASGPTSLALAGFTGSGTFNVTAGLQLAAPTLQYVGMPDCSTSTTTTLDSVWSGTVKIDYIYETPVVVPPTPGVAEPASLYLSAGALLGLAWLRRSGRRTSKPASPSI